MTYRGLIIARHRRDVVIEADSREVTHGLIKGRKLKPLCGDEVLWHPEQDGTAIVDEILPRRTLLERIDSRGQTEGVAANASILVIVVAPQPAPDWALVDRYLVAAELQGIQAVLVRNKQDVADPPTDARLETYTHIGYPVIHTCVPRNTGISSLASILQGERGVLVGQSGVGKSSIMNALLGTDAQEVGELSRRHRHGRHTTTASMLHRLPNGGEIIDSPGVRRYAPQIDDPNALARGFAEFSPFLGRCRFHNCQHLQEPECAIRQALDAGLIDANRYRSFVALRETMEDLRSRRGPKAN